MDKEKKEEKKTKTSQKKIIFIAISAVILVLLGILIFRFSPENNKTMDIEDAKVKAENFINESLMMPGTKATITEIEAEYGLYKISVDVGQGELIESYISQDGELFIPSSIDMEEYEDLFNQQMNEMIEMESSEDNTNNADTNNTDMEEGTINMEDIEIIQE
jgi:hypothetical protein